MIKIIPIFLILNCVYAPIKDLTAYEYSRKTVLLNQVFKNARKDVHHIEIYKKEFTLTGFLSIITYSYFVIGEIKTCIKI